MKQLAVGVRIIILLTIIYSPVMTQAKETIQEEINPITKNIVIYNGIEFDISTGTVTDYSGTETTLEIPSEINGVSVKTIGWSAFYNCTNLSSITIPDSVTSIGVHAFNGCTNLSNIIIPSSVTSIEHAAFSSCENLTSVTFLYGITKIGSFAFSGCTSLSKVSFSSSITSIGSFAFNQCKSLYSITIPNGVTNIESQAFANCEALSNIEVSNGNSYYTSIDGVLFNKQITKIIAYPAGKTALEYSVPDSVTSIGLRAFSKCKNLNSITLPQGVISIGDRVFEECINLYSITIPRSVTSIGEGAFYRCTSLKSIVIPNSVLNIGDWVFGWCTKLSNITIGESVKNIENWAFYNCVNLSRITIPDNVTSIGEWTFTGCSKDLTICGIAGSYAETYAVNNNIPFVAENTPTPTPMPGRWVIESTAPNGTVTQRSRYTEEGILEITEYYTDDNVLIQKIHFKPDGTKRATQEYHVSGGLKSNITYDESGEVVTNTENYDESGTLITRVYYYPGLIPYLANHYREDGTRSAMQEFYESGNLKTNIFYEATGDVVTDTENYGEVSGRLLTRVYYSKGLIPYLTNHYRKDGTRYAMQEFYESGNLKTNIFYEATGDVVTNTENYDEISGRLLTRVYYYPGLIPHVANHYREDETRNVMQEFYESGNLKTNIFYGASGDIIVSTENYDSTGTVLKTRVEYDDEFHPTKTTYYRVDGTKYKEHEYYPSGVIQTEINYDENENETSRINYDEDGNAV